MTTRCVHCSDLTDCTADRLCAACEDELFGVASRLGIGRPDAEFLAWLAQADESALVPMCLEGGA